MKLAGVPGSGSGSTSITVVDSTDAAELAPVALGSIALYTDAGLTSDDEHCSLDPQLAAALGIVGTDVDGVQVRITTSGGESALFTFVALTAAASDLHVGLNAGGFSKLDSAMSSLSGCTISTRCTWTGYTAAQSDPALGGDTDGLLLERLRDDGAETYALYTAPHGGQIEAWTDEQADTAAAYAGRSAWICEGYSRTFTTGGFATPSTSAAARWHITSPDIGYRSFPLLGTLSRRGFTYACSFHGLSDATAAALGGGASSLIVGGAGLLADRQAIAAAIQAIPGFTGAGYTARAAVSGDAPFAGNDASNYINRITGSVANGVFTSTGAGFQIEQSTSVRAAYWSEIATAVATAIEAL